MPYYRITLELTHKKTITGIRFHRSQDINMIEGAVRAMARKRYDVYLTKVEVVMLSDKHPDVLNWLTAHGTIQNLELRSIPL